jgi:cyclopropane-fatty-acyl-phospholipid synthase
LDIGCGWGSLILHAVQQHGARAVGITPAGDQANYIESRARQEGLTDHVRVRCADWREVSGKFDRIISVGMMDKYIFPGGYLPTLAEIAWQSARAGLYVLDVENLKSHYALTLDCWLTNFQAAFDRIVALRGERFPRMWSLYLHGAEGAFRWGDLQLWQIVLAKDQQHYWPLNREVTATCLTGSPKDDLYFQQQ